MYVCMHACMYVYIYIHMPYMYIHDLTSISCHCCTWSASAALRPCRIQKRRVAERLISRHEEKSSGAKAVPGPAWQPNNSK